MQYHWTANVAEVAGDIHPDSILSRTLFKNAHVKAVLFTFDAGQSLSEHTASQAAVIQIISGEATLTLGEDTFEAGPGAMAYMEPNLKHGLVARSPLTMLLFLFQPRTA